MPDLTKIKTVIMVLMENRSFDHMLGYLSLPPQNRTEVEGQSTDPGWLTRFTNTDHGQPRTPARSADQYTYALPPGFDPPHERINVAAHLGSPQNGSYPMNGFVSAIPPTVSADPATRALVMSYFGAEQVPMNHFLATHFTICDHWHCPLPAGTQPNRLMAMSGVTTIDTNRTILPPQELVYDWLTKRGVTWRVYHQGLPFFTLMTKWIPEMLGSNHFRPFLALEEDLNNTPPDDMPQVLFIEPTYTDAPHLGRSTDDHAPSGVSDGQEFLMQAYNAVTTSLDFWRGALMIVTYDEHGGFFDHVAPPPIATNPPRPGLYPPLHSLGVRVPAYVVSPFVRPGAVSHLLFDHTSILKFLGERFGQGSYSAVVDVRPVKSVAEVLESNAVTSPPPAAPALHDYLSLRPSVPTATVPNNGTPLEKGFQHAVGEMRRQGADQNHPKFGPLLKQINQLPSPGSAGSGS